MLNHPYENGTGHCDSCHETMVPPDEYGGLFYDPCVDDCTGWRCNYCNDVVFGGHGEEWRTDEREDADRIWQWGMGSNSEDWQDGPTQDKPGWATRPPKTVIVSRRKR